MIPRTPATRLLNRYYGQIDTLQDHLEARVVFAEDCSILREEDGEGYRQLLQETLVATANVQAKETLLGAVTACQNAEDMSDVVMRALHAIFFGRKANRANVLAQGYQVGASILLQLPAQCEVGCLSKRFARYSPWNSCAYLYEHPSHFAADLGRMAATALSVRYL